MEEKIEFLESILKQKKRKKVSIHQSFPNLTENSTEIFEGIIESTGKDYIVLSNPNTGSWFILLLMYTDYFKFDEEINI